MNDFRKSFNEVVDHIAKYENKWPVAIKMTNKCLDNMLADTRVYEDTQLSSSEKLNEYYWQFNGLPIYIDDSLKTNFILIYDWGEIGK